MKPSACLSLVLAVLLGFGQLCVAQTPTGCDQLRSKIEKLERMDMKAMSASIQQVYKEALLKLYTQLTQCIQQEVSITTEMRATVAGTDAAQPVEDKLKALAEEKADTESNLTALRAALNLPDAPPQSDPPPADMATDPARSVARAGAGGGASQTALGCLPGEAYTDAPVLLRDIVEKDARDIVRGDSDAIASLSKMLLYATADAASPTASKLLRGLEAYQYLSETARTDKQLGASSSSNGVVSAIEKPGFARLLGFAIEHGAINKENDGTNLTLSTSLYSLFTINGGDTAETYTRAGVLNRIGASATFAVQNKDSELANARRNNLSEWSVRARLFGDRSTRSAEFSEFWEKKIVPLIDARLAALGGPIEDLSEKNDRYRGLTRQLDICLNDAVSARKNDADYKAAPTEEAKAKIIGDMLLGILRSSVYNRVKAGQLLTAEETVRIETQYVPNLKIALDDLKGANSLIAKTLEDVNKGPLGTFAYTNHRQPNASDYSETKFLFEQDKGFMRPLKLTGNFGLSFYHRPDGAMNQQKLRDVSAALSFEGTSASPFTEDENQSKVTYSFVGRYQRLFENRRMANRKPDIATAQFLVEVPLLKGFSLPFSLSYANATEEERKKNVKFNFGMRLDTDKLFDMLMTPTSER